MIDSKPIHTVCGVGDGKLWVITAYIPGTDKWEDDFKAIPHNPCASDAQSDFSSECINLTQAG